jgi:hypothetical protein
MSRQNADGMFQNGLDFFSYFLVNTTFSKILPFFSSPSTILHGCFRADCSADFLSQQNISSQGRNNKKSE